MEFILLFIIGSSLGSFLNVLSDRLSTGRPFISGRSYCEHCHKTLEPRDLVPVVSYLILRGKCRHCKSGIPSHLFFVEGIIGFLAIAVYLYTLTFLLPIQGILLFLILYFFVGIFVADILYGIIPDLMVGISLFLSVLYVIISGTPLLAHILSGVGALLFFLLLFAGTKGRGMGFGDVKLSFVLGTLLGYPNIIIALYIAFLTGAAVSIILVVWRKLRFFGGTIPFGPFLILGTIIALFYGQQIAAKFLGSFL